jgi:uncharacterized membrane protein YqjE
MESLEQPVTQPGDEASPGELISRASQQVSQLVREELKLAQAEMKQKGGRFALGGGLFGGAGLLAFLGLEVLLAAAVIALAHALPLWASALVVAAVLLLAAAVMGAVAKNEVGRAAPPAPEQAVAGLKADIATIKESTKR